MGGPELSEAEIDSLMAGDDSALEEMDLDQVGREVDRLLVEIGEDYIKPEDKTELGKTA